MSEARCSVCGARFRKEDHIYEKTKEDLPWTALKDRVSRESLDLTDSMSTNGVTSMGTYHKMLVLSETLRAIESQMRHAANQQRVEP